MTIELLIELSRRLNFTYDLKLPPDGNNIWTGLIGQLQRREVDLVAAPLVIDVLRETVADFTQPYFYEQSGIIIKKPVISYSTKLQDPVNPMMCGQHVAASSAGKTLLSCWWVFCITMAATYSGNFVAILTVTKKKLPFKDAEGLVAQNTYKWGTAGATVFETILENRHYHRNWIDSNVAEENMAEARKLSRSVSYRRKNFRLKMWLDEFCNYTEFYECGLITYT
ncbi:unnamed protein product [Mytilus coruscus]|uniref:Ionotropic glutamate receptor L-glutamate and glycine-binding domain-containing protein n=1 Tax=Mytilus coruscus TaxID=42192 RepID=A0A6J8CYG4_MYTCO|nr:unnamed protein product [Mytilus coruscus]